MRRVEIYVKRKIRSSSRTLLCVFFSALICSKFIKAQAKIIFDEMQGFFCAGVEIYVKQKIRSSSRKLLCISLRQKFAKITLHTLLCGIRG